MNVRIFLGKKFCNLIVMRNSLATVLTLTDSAVNKTDNYTIIMFLKFGSEIDIKDLYENGTIYLNPIDRFRKIEDNELRGDNYEGVNRIWNLPSGEFEILSIRHKVKYINMHLRESYQNVLGNIYSIYCISSYGFASPNDFFIDKKVERFGSYFLMVKDNPRFLQLIEDKLNLLGLKFHHGFVRYYDKKSINGQITLFQKPNEFEYQKEFRIYVDSASLTPLVLKIGSLKNIAEVYKTEIIHDIKLINQ